MVKDKIKLRAMEPSDLDLMYDWENNQDIKRAGDSLQYYSKQVIEEFIDRREEDIYQSGQMRLVIVLESDEKEALGYIDLYDFDAHNRKAAVGILIGKVENRRKGYANEALELLKKFAFDRLLLNQLYCFIEYSNKESIDLFVKSGFSKNAVLQKWIKNAQGYNNVVLMQCLYSESS